MFSRQHPAVIDGWSGVQWKAKGGGWILALFLSVGTVAMLLPAPHLEVQKIDAGRSVVLYHSRLVNTCYGTYHIVRPGETVYSIARLYGSTAYRIQYCNGLSSYTVYTGQRLLVPLYRARW